MIRRFARATPSAAPSAPAVQATPQLSRALRTLVAEATPAPRRRHRFTRADAGVVLVIVVVYAIAWLLKP